MCTDFVKWKIFLLLSVSQKKFDRRRAQNHDFRNFGRVVRDSKSSQMKIAGVKSLFFLLHCVSNLLFHLCMHAFPKTARAPRRCKPLTFCASFKSSFAFYLVAPRRLWGVCIRVFRSIKTQHSLTGERKRNVNFLPRHSFEWRIVKYWYAFSLLQLWINSYFYAYFFLNSIYKFVLFVQEKIALTSMEIMFLYSLVYFLAPFSAMRETTDIDRICCDMKK